MLDKIRSCLGTLKTSVSKVLKGDVPNQGMPIVKKLNNVSSEATRNYKFRYDILVFTFFMSNVF